MLFSNTVYTAVVIWKARVENYAIRVNKIKSFCGFWRMYGLEVLVIEIHHSKNGLKCDECLLFDLV